MALINCPECGKEISDSTKICPHCAFVFRFDYFSKYLERNSFVRCFFGFHSLN